MYEELLAAINNLTIAVNGVLVTLAIIAIVLLLKSTNSDAAIHSLQQDVKNAEAAISGLSRNLCAELRRRVQDDV